MKSWHRWVLALIDVVTVAIPLTAFLAAYVIVARPAWFLNFVNEIYKGEGT